MTLERKSHRRDKVHGKSRLPPIESLKVFRCVWNLFRDPGRQQPKDCFAHKSQFNRGVPNHWPKDSQDLLDAAFADPSPLLNRPADKHFGSPKLYSVTRAAALFLSL
jgi:hypothetical protein